MNPTRIESTDAYDWAEILRESQAEGYNMVNRLLSDFGSAFNRFDAPGEALYAHFSGQVVVAVAGLNREANLSYPRSGRVRRLYVLPSCRGNGKARTLIEELARHALGHFDSITVNVGKLDARGFYEHLGFVPVQHDGITHISMLGCKPA